MLDWEKRYTDIAESGTDVAVFPVGACEGHGTHLPLATDSLLTQRVAEAIAEELNAYLLPLLPFGTSAEHLAFRGTIALRHSTLAAILEDVLDSLTKTGFHCLIIVSLHGGNYLLNSDFLKLLRNRHPGMRIVYYDVRDAWRAARKEAGIETRDWHAGEIETSLIMALRPELVGEAKEDFPIPSDGFGDVAVDHTGFPYDVSQVSPQGVLGCPSKASRRKGEVFLRSLLEYVVSDIKRKLM